MKSISFNCLPEQLFQWVLSRHLPEGVVLGHKEVAEALYQECFPHSKNYMVAFCGRADYKCGDFMDTWFNSVGRNLSVRVQSCYRNVQGIGHIELFSVTICDVSGVERIMPLLTRAGLLEGEKQFAAKIKRMQDDAKRESAAYTRRMIITIIALAAAAVMGGRYLLWG